MEIAISTDPANRERPLEWVRKTEILTFRFGRHTIKRRLISAVSLETPCTSLTFDIDATFAQLPSIPDDCDAVVLPSHPIRRDLPRFAGWFAPVLRYVSNSGPRQLVDLRGTFEEYIAKFTHNRRNWLARKARRFAELSGGTLELKTFSAPREMLEFQQAAASITAKTYKARVGAAFEESAEDLAGSAGREGVRGYVLYSQGSPVAYQLWRVQARNLVLATTAYDPAHAKASPGMVLLWLALQSLFEEQRFDYLDFLWGQYPYKKVFATATINVAAVFCFRNTLRNKLLALSHYSLILATRAMIRVTQGFGLAPLAGRFGEKLRGTR
ncbi:MAG: GNAT family N-acetyltransferase [Acidobacteriia bacterium]|nr:GNAT family N-acetyltransferase [Terriglobia bacterium]